jgi:Rrf2 family protein
MASVLRISEGATLALHTTALLASRPGKVMSTRKIAAILKVSEAHLSKVLQRLARLGLVRSIRGARGGFLIGHEPEDATLLDVYEAIDGPLRPSTCLMQHRACQGRGCIFGKILETINEDVRKQLASRRVIDLAPVFANIDVEETAALEEVG